METIQKYEVNNREGKPKQIRIKLNTKYNIFLYFIQQYNDNGVLENVYAVDEKTFYDQ